MVEHKRSCGVHFLGKRYGKCTEDVEFCARVCSSVPLETQTEQT